MNSPVVDVAIPPLGLGGSFMAPGLGVGVVIFAHGNGSSRFSSRNRLVAEALQQPGLGRRICQHSRQI